MHAARPTRRLAAAAGSRIAGDFLCQARVTADDQHRARRTGYAQSRLLGDRLRRRRAHHALSWRHSTAASLACTGGALPLMTSTPEAVRWWERAPGKSTRLAVALLL